MGQTETATGSARSSGGLRALDALDGRRLDVLVVSLLGAIAAVVFWRFLTLDRVYLFKDVGADTVNGFYPRLVHIANYLRADGLPGWSFNQGMGQYIFPGSMGNPFQWVQYLLGADRLAYAFAYLEVLKIVLGGWVFSRFLRLLALTPFSVTTGSVLFGFTGFMILGGSWFIFSTEAVYLAVLLYAFERYFQHGHWGWVPIVFLLIGAAQPFNLVTHGLFLFLYSTFRYADTHGFRPRAYTFFLTRLAGLSMLGVLMSAFFLVAGVVEMTHSVRVGGEGNTFAQLAAFPVFGLESARHYGTVIMRLFSNDLLGTGNSFRGWQHYLGAPMFYVGLLPLLLAPQVFGLPDRHRYLYPALVAVLLVPIVFPFFRYASWLFSGDYYRFYSLAPGVFLVVFALIALSRIERGGKVRVPLLTGTLAVLLALLYLTPAATGLEVDRALQARVAFMLGVYAAGVFALRFADWRTPVQVALLAAVALEVVWLGTAAVNQRPNVTGLELRQKTGYNDFSADAAAYLRQIDPGFYRVEKTFTSSPSIYTVYRNDALVQGYRGTSSYHSFNHPSYIAFLEAVLPAKAFAALARNKYRMIQGLFARPILQSVASVKYLMSRAESTANLAVELGLAPRFAERAYEPIHRVGDVTVFRNRAALPFGFTYDRYIPHETFTALPMRSRELALVHGFVPPEGAPALVRAFAPYDPSLRGTSLWEALDQRRAEVLEITSHGQNYITGVISTERRKLLFLSIPFDEGWSARVDGTVVALRRANVGFSGLILEPGEHRVELTYHSPFRAVSAAVSLLALGAYLALAWTKRAGRHRNETGGNRSKRSKQREIVAVHGAKKEEPRMATDKTVSSVSSSSVASVQSVVLKNIARKPSTRRLPLFSPFPPVQNSSYSGPWLVCQPERLGC